MAADIAMCRRRWQAIALGLGARGSTRSADCVIPSVSVAQASTTSAERWLDVALAWHRRHVVTEQAYSAVGSMSGPPRVDFPVDLQGRPAAPPDSIFSAAGVMSDATSVQAREFFESEGYV
eukprot:SAG31_NODE_1389_length_8545_cov_3.081103_3_plen_121_part_00